MSIRLNLRPTDTVAIGDGILVTVEHKSGLCTRLVIQAPDEMRIVKIASSVNSEAAATPESGEQFPSSQL